MFWTMWACGEPTPSETADPGCGAGTPDVEIAQSDTPWGLADGDPLWCDIPPQGGAPYAPLRLRARGLPDVSDAFVEVDVRDADDGVLLGTAAQTHGLLCANTGEDDGWWVGGEVHARFGGFELADLAGRTVDVELRLEADGTRVVAAYQGPIEVP